MECANVNEETSPQKKKKKAPSLESANTFETIAAGMPVMQKCERCSVLYGNFLVTLVETKANTLLFSFPLAGSMTSQEIRVRLLHKQDVIVLKNRI